MSSGSTTGKQLVKRWFDELERQLTEEAQHAGLLGHSSMTGNAREFFVRRVLRSFMPSAVRVGTGRVIGSDDSPSKQVDIVVFDGRLPAFDMPDGQSLFPIEGVIGVIEVKSRLDVKTLHSALDNCFSVARCGIGVVTSELNAQLVSKQGPAGDRKTLPEDIIRLIAPRAYIFGFNGLRTPRDLNRGLQSWLKERGYPAAGSRPFLPSIVVSGGAVGVAYGDPLRVEGADLRTADGTRVEQSETEILMWVLEASERFGWLATHLLYAIENRRLEQDAVSRLRVSVGNYFPFEEYYNQHRADKPRLTIARIPNTCLTRDNVEGAERES